MADTLLHYRTKRNFAVTPEPAEGGASRPGTLAFVVQKHWASSLHYDFRLELDGAMKSWAVPKGPSYDPHDKRMAVQVEDHPIAYNQFEGQIPAGQYGAGKVIIWDEGVWQPLVDPRNGYEEGMLKFELQGVKMRGRWALVRMKGRGGKQIPWLLIKEKDSLARPASDFSVVDEMPDSVVPLREQAPAESAKKAAGRTTAKASKETVQIPGKAFAHLPATLSPQLATLVDGVPGDAAQWIFEIKFDGYRMLTRVEDGKVRIFTRNGHDWTHKLAGIAQAVARLKLRTGWLDGEVVVLDERGVPDFQALQNAFDTDKPAQGARAGRIAYCLFDVPYLDGRDLREEPVETRRALLQQVLASSPSDLLRFSDAFDVRPQDLMASACRLGLEGLIAKQKGAPYVTRRSTSWVKLKCTQRQEFVIVGYTDPQGSRVGLGSLLLAIHDDKGGLRYVGNVGTGFNDKVLGHLLQQLQALATDKRPLKESTDLDRSAHWVKPQLLAEVSFAAWTSTGRVRHAVFHGLRSDKPARAITREKAMPAAKVAAARKSTAHASTTRTTTPPRATPSKATAGAASDAPDTDTDTAADTGSLRVTHGDRVIDASTGITKLDLVRYYGLVAPLLLHHLKGRPTSIVRAPSGIAGELFFQKHLEGKMPGVVTLSQALDPEHPPLIEVPTARAVLSAAQMNVVEFHTWNALKTAIDKPDRMTFDLDPGDGVPWKAMQQATMLMRVFLEQLGLRCFAKTSGGKGMHVVVPLKRQHGWDTVKALSQAIVQHMAQTIPDRFVAKSGPRNRVGKIFIDYLRNGFGATTVSAWSARARPGLGVSVPVAWDEVEGLGSSAQWTVANIHTRLDKGNAPWADYAPQGVAKAMKLLGFKPS